MSWSWTSTLLKNRRIVCSGFFIFSEEALELLIQFSGWGKEEV